MSGCAALNMCTNKYADVKLWMSVSSPWDWKALARKYLAGRAADDIDWAEPRQRQRRISRLFSTASCCPRGSWEFYRDWESAGCSALLFSTAVLLQRLGVCWDFVSRWISCKGAAFSNFAWTGQLRPTGILALLPSELSCKGDQRD